MSPFPVEAGVDPTQVSIDLPLFEQFYALVLAIAQQHTGSFLSTTDKNGSDVLNGSILRPSHQF